MAPGRPSPLLGLPSDRAEPIRRRRDVVATPLGVTAGVGRRPATAAMCDPARLAFSGMLRLDRSTLSARSSRAESGKPPPARTGVVLSTTLEPALAREGTGTVRRGASRGRSGRAPGAVSLAGDASVQRPWLQSSGQRTSWRRPSSLLQLGCPPAVVHARREPRHRTAWAAGSQPG